MIFMASPLLRMMTIMDNHHMIAMKVIVPICLYLVRKHSLLDQSKLNRSTK